MSRTFNEPLSANDMPRFGGVATMMRLPLVSSAAGLDAGFIGIPLDIGTSNRSGTRFGPRQIRAESVLCRPFNVSTGAAPFDSLRIADLGDIALNPYNLEKSIDLIEAGIRGILAHGCRPIALGGDHTLTLPVLRAIRAAQGRPVGLVHVDAHADVNDLMFGEKIAHGTPFRRAVEEGLIEPRRTVQIGLRGSGYSPADFDWPREQGFRMVMVEECWHRSLSPLMAEVRTLMGSGPVYLTFDIDSLDPGFAPGTGTPEMAGLTPIQAVEIIRGCRGLDLVGADLVEVSPPYDPTGNTALLAAQLLLEILCVLPGVAYRT